MSESAPGSLILQQKWEDLSVYLFSCVLRDMPKSERFTLGADIRAVVWEVEAALVQLSLRAGNRWTLLNTVDVKAKILLAMIRLGIRVGAIRKNGMNRLPPGWWKSERLSAASKKRAKARAADGERPGYAAIWRCAAAITIMASARAFLASI